MVQTITIEACWICIVRCLYGSFDRLLYVFVLLESWVDLYVEPYDASYRGRRVRFSVMDACIYSYIFVSVMFLNDRSTSCRGFIID